MSAADALAQRRQWVPFAALSATYFAHIGFFNPYLPLWLKDMGLPIVVISLLTSMQSFTRVLAPYAWGALSDHTGERVRLLRYSAVAALIASLGLWVDGGAWWVAVVLLVLFVHTSSMMSLTEAAMAHLVAGDWGRYGRIRLWGSIGFMLTVFASGVWFERFGMDHFPAWSFVTLMAVLVCTWRLPDVREAPTQAQALAEPIWPVLRQPVVAWFLVSLFFHVMAHFAVYGYLSLYLDALGYSKTMIGLLWAVSVLVEIVWFFAQGRWISHFSMARWLVVCAAVAAVRMGVTAGLSDWLIALFFAQALHAVTFAAHHTACIALVSRHFPGRLRGRGQALFTVIGYGFGGVLGVLTGGWLASRFGFEMVFAVATLTAVAATASALKVQRLESSDSAARAAA